MWIGGSLSSEGDSGSFAMLLRSWPSSSAAFLPLLVAKGGTVWEVRGTTVVDVVLWGGFGLPSEAMACLGERASIERNFWTYKRFFLC